MADGHLLSIQKLPEWNALIGGITRLVDSYISKYLPSVEDKQNEHDINRQSEGENGYKLWII